MSVATSCQQPTNGGKLHIHLRPRAVYLTLLSVIAVLAILSCLAKTAMLSFPPGEYGALNELCKRFYFDFENNVPAWFSTLGLFVSAFIFALISFADRQTQSVLSRYWLGLAIVFVGLAVDEATYSHEILIVALRNKFDLGGIFYFAWVIPGMVGVAVFGLLYVPFLRRLPARTAWGLVIAGAIYVGGALGVELIGGSVAETYGFDSARYVLIMTIEETLEMIGIATLIFVLMVHLRDVSGSSLELDFS
jgi:hypothetical protein